MANRLEHEDSPYLQQHKHSLVDWWPWCEEAFLKAKEENKAIFISIGYSSCHWCHLMEEQVFQNRDSIEILSENFVCIKVDKEERPDIDKYYQKVYQLLNNRTGASPISIFCTPQNKPFLARTYISVDSVAGSNEGVGFKEIANIIATKVKENDAELFQNADEIDSFIKKTQHPKEATVLKEEFYKNFILQAQKNFDLKHGGFSSQPKFPHATTLGALLDLTKLYQLDEAKSMLLQTLDAMKKGGMYDLVEGGFCRYSTDEKWLVPRFEKTLYDNALLSALYTDSYLSFGDLTHLQIAKECADFWHNFMSEDNLFYSTSDANSDDIEGNYFIYSYEEVLKALLHAGYKDAKSMCVLMSITPEGNFQGKNIVHFTGEIPEWFTDVKIILSHIRSKRSYPFIDKKVQTSWSAMMIDSLFKLGSIDNRYKQRALKNLDALLNKLYVDSQLYHTTLIHKKPKVEAFLEDYAFLSKALITAYKYSDDELYLIQAQRFTNKALELFYEKGVWHFSVGALQTKAEITDNTYTSCVGVMVDVLLSLTTLLKDEKYKHFAFKTMEYNSYEIGRKPIYTPSMLLQIIRYLQGE